MLPKYFCFLQLRMCFLLLKKFLQGGPKKAPYIFFLISIFPSEDFLNYFHQIVAE